MTLEVRAIKKAQGGDSTLWNVFQRDLLRTLREFPEAHDAVLVLIRKLIAANETG